MEKNGHHIILDAYNANPTSMRAALENFNLMEAPNKVLIIGDMFELGQTAAEEHQSIADLAAGLDFSTVYLVGENFFGTTTTLNTYRSFDDLKQHLAKTPLPKGTLLIKGSRGMALERVLELL
jgi:UDP-N-acetylmuramoyl-tripeptide--D-alanyl-D-alanine ligase